MCRNVCTPREHKSLWRCLSSAFFSLLFSSKLSSFSLPQHLPLLLRCNKIEVCQRTYNRLQPMHITKFDIDYNSNYFLTTRNLTHTYSAHHHSFKYNSFCRFYYIQDIHNAGFIIGMTMLNRAQFITLYSFVSFYYLFLFLSLIFHIFIIFISYNISSALPLSYLFLYTIYFFDVLQDTSKCIIIPASIYAINEI